MIASIIIPTCERNEDLSLCLDRLRPEVQAVPADMFEVVVSDDGRRSTAREVMERNYPWARWIEGPRRGPAANRNHGSDAAQGDWIIFIDDDCLPEPGLLQAYFEVMKHDKARVLEGRTLPVGVQHRVDMSCPANETGGYLWSCNMAIRRDLFFKMAGFDPGFPGPAMEDVDFRTRLSKAGEDIKFVPQATVLHPWKPWRGLAFASSHAKSRVYFVGKHPELLPTISWRALGLEAARRIVMQLPRDIRQVGVHGAGNMLVEAIYYPFALRRALGRARKIQPR